VGTRYLVNSLLVDSSEEETCLLLEAFGVKRRASDDRSDIMEMSIPGWWNFFHHPGDDSETL
jgi:hypothetical protein